MKNKTSSCANGLHPSALNPSQEVRQQRQQSELEEGKNEECSSNLILQ